MKKDITKLEDIKLLVSGFYGRVREDGALKDIFNNVVQNRWSEHLEKLYRFGQTILFTDHIYYGPPFPQHAIHPIAGEHSEQWLNLLVKLSIRYLLVKKPKGKQDGWQKCFIPKLSIIIKIKQINYDGI